jgi:bile acid:Na+ symporter, BASS family
MKTYIYPISIFVVACIAFSFPQYFIEVNGYPLKKLIPFFLQVIMFGMGTTMSKEDFLGIVRMPKAVVIGLICQFTIMPFLGFAIARTFDFPPEIAAGVLLVGCSPSGLASNVMAYIAKANVALSITITSCATLLAPILTPFLMKALGGQYIEIEFWGMFWDISKMVIFPVIVGYLVNLLLRDRGQWLQKVLPLISMIGIGFIILIVTAAGQKSLQMVGFSLIIATLMHNLGGFLLGYWGARFSGLVEQDCRTVAIEVGLQNAGMASGLAVAMGKIATLGVAPALFGPIMNITGSLLAGWWSKKDVK